MDEWRPAPEHVRQAVHEAHGRRRPARAPGRRHALTPAPNGRPRLAQADPEAVAEALAPGVAEAHSVLLAGDVIAVAVQVAVEPVELVAALEVRHRVGRAPHVVPCVARA